MEPLKKYGQLGKLYSSGLMAISLIIVQAFITAGKLSLAEYVAILSFAIAIPSLAGSIVLDFLDTEDEQESSKSAQQANGRLWNIGIMSAFTGICATFWHISALAGIIFFLASFFISGTVSRVISREVRSLISDP